jgi:hypothetical protein
MALVYQAAQTLTTTNLQTLASSPTSIWISDTIDNTSDLYLDRQFQFDFDWAAGAPANSACAVVWIVGFEGTNYPKYFSGTEGAGVTIADFTSNKMPHRELCRVPYRVSGEQIVMPVVALSDIWAIHPPKVGLLVANHAGVALAAATIKHWGVSIS